MDRPGIFYPMGQEVVHTNTLGNCPLLCEGAPGSYVEMTSFISALMSTRKQSTYCPRVFFIDDKTKEHTRLLPPLNQIRFHDTLNNSGFNFENFPIKVQKWDDASHQWLNLTVDCILQVLAYLVYVDKGGKNMFADMLHTEQFLSFETKEIVYEMKACIQASPYLMTREGVKECLKITHTIPFSKVMIAVPASMQPPPADFMCSVCLLGGSSTDNIFQATCGTDAGHCFHRHCIDSWFRKSRCGKRSCPLCRTLITSAI